MISIQMERLMPKEEKALVKISQLLIEERVPKPSYWSLPPTTHLTLLIRKLSVTSACRIQITM
jgi:hypothetical protein